ncbi:hypothetical protein K388_07115 [Streptomyces sp. KhCrAH-43]|uniref:hypothetical protein n=1 Tax=unclassified Streptomyces TaxID=2593676 RepID=UPI0003650321|nr:MULTISPECIES: hypothetical protein [unclassified Streptomyces]MYS36335.1 hypothetical protein [Streptomyces sp. SID4920]MYX63990.1 hypothetical protein [Streptomyces sp. SID8373]RAJ47838.1 hypothetical protein K388_07115 [Streptomyces sp. KhCrAH-43]
MTTTASSLTLRGPLSFDGVPIRCPGREDAPAPRRLNLLVSGKAVMASCGEMHRAKDGGGAKTKCFFAVEVMTPAMVKSIIDSFEPNARFRVTLPGGKILEGRRGRAVKAAPAGGGTASSAFAAKKAAARGGKRPAARRSGGGGLVAALNTVTAVAGTATAAVNAVGSAANTVGAAANAAGKGFDMGREGMKTGRDAIRAIDNARARSFARENRKPDSGGDAE